MTEDTKSEFNNMHEELLEAVVVFETFIEARRSVKLTLYLGNRSFNERSVRTRIK